MPVARSPATRPAASAFSEPCSGGPRLERESGSLVYLRRYVSTASAMSFSDAIAASSFLSASAESHSSSREGKSRRTRPSERIFHSPFSRTRPMFTWIALAPEESVASRKSTGRNATLSRVSAPPIWISAAPAGVSQRTMGRPAGLAVTAGLPASLSRTNRFMKATRAAGAMRENDSLLRAVRKLANSFWLCEQAAFRTSRSAADGPFGEAAWAAGFPLDSCAEAPLASGSSSAVRRSAVAVTVFFRNFTSILCGAQDRGQVLGKGRAGHPLVAACRLRLGCQIELHVREKPDDLQVFLRSAHALDGRKGLAARIQIDYDQTWRGFQQA